MATRHRLKEREVRWARAFLHAIYGNEQNGYLLLAVIAWMRDARGPWSKNNPLGIKQGNRLLVFGTYTASAQYAARKLLKSHREDYRLIVRKLQAKPTKATLQIEQAENFLYALALSKWDDMHYGMYTLGYNPLKHEYIRTLDPSHPEKNRLLEGWYALTGVHIPKDWFTDTIHMKSKPAKPRPDQDPSHAAGVPRFEYIDPYAAVNFYDSRRHAADTMMQGA